MSASRSSSPVPSPIGSKRKRQVAPQTPTKKFKAIKEPPTPATQLALDLQSVDVSTTISNFERSLSPTPTTLRWNSAVEKFNTDCRNLLNLPGDHKISYSIGKGKNSGFLQDAEGRKPLDFLIVSKVLDCYLEQYRTFGNDKSYQIMVECGNSIKDSIIQLLQKDPDWITSDFKTPVDTPGILQFKRSYLDCFKPRQTWQHTTDSPPPFPFLRDAREAHTLRPGENLPTLGDLSLIAAGATVAVQARLFKYDFVLQGSKERKIGVSLRLYAVLLLDESTSTDESGTEDEVIKA